jgi:hypothetical protein
MAEPKRVTVELSDFLRDLDPVAIKGLVSAPIAWRASRLIEALPRKYGDVGYGELISLLIHATDPDSTVLAAMIEDYREDQVWETRRSVSDDTEKAGPWQIELRGPGRRKQ